MKLYKNAAEQVRGKQDWSMTGRVFSLILLPPEAVNFDDSHSSVDEILKAQNKEVDRSGEITVIGDSRVKYNEPNQRQVLFLVENRNLYREQILNHRGGGLLYERKVTAPTTVLAKPETYDEQVGSERIGSNANPGDPDEQEDEKPKRSSRKTKASAQEQEEQSEEGPIAMLSKADLTVLANGEGLLTTWPTMQPA